MHKFTKLMHQFNSQFQLSLIYILYIAYDKFLTPNQRAEQGVLELELEAFMVYQLYFGPY